MVTDESLGVIAGYLCLGVTTNLIISFSFLWIGIQSTFFTMKDQQNFLSFFFTIFGFLLLDFFRQKK
jgi:hypothetical protein